MPSAQSSRQRRQDHQQQQQPLGRRRPATIPARGSQQAPKPEKTNKAKQKKPFYFKKADLNLDEYRQELLDRSPKELAMRALKAVMNSKQFWLFVFLQTVVAAIGYGRVMLCIGILWMFYSNTGKRKAGEKSAYSIFNEGVEAINGSTDMQMLDRELRRQLY